MAAFLSPTPTLRFYGTNGHPLANGWLITYDSSTSQPRATWSDKDKTTANPVQIPLDANGEPVVNGVNVGIYLDVGRSYKYRWFDKHGTPIGEMDGITSGLLQNGLRPILVDEETGDISIEDKSIGIEKLEDGALGFVTPEMFGAKGDGVTDDTDAIQRAIDFNENKNNVVILLAENYLVKKGGLRLRNNVALISQNGSTIKTNSEALDADDSYGFMLGLSVADSDELHDRTGDWLHDVVISGITFDQSLETYIDESTIDSSSKRMRPIFIYGVRNLRIYDCKFILKGANAVSVGRLTSSDIFVENNIVENLTKSYNYDQSAIYVQGTFAHITNNTIADNVNTSSISPMRGGIEIHGYGFVVSDNVIKNVVSAFNISCYRGQFDRPDGMFNEVVNNQAYCTDFIELWNQQAVGIDPVTLGYLNVNGNIAYCRRVCRTVYNVEHLSLTSDINFVSNVFYGSKLTNLSSRTIAVDNAAIRFNFLTEAKNLKFANNVFSNFECCLFVVSAGAGVDVSNIEIVDNVFNNCFY